MSPPLSNDQLSVEGLPELLQHARTNMANTVEICKNRFYKPSGRWLNRKWGPSLTPTGQVEIDEHLNLIVYYQCKLTSEDGTLVLHKTKIRYVGAIDSFYDESRKQKSGAFMVPGHIDNDESGCPEAMNDNVKFKVTFRALKDNKLGIYNLCFDDKEILERHTNVWVRVPEDDKDESDADESDANELDASESPEPKRPKIKTHEHTSMIDPRGECKKSCSTTYGIMQQEYHLSTAVAAELVDPSKNTRDQVVDWLQRCADTTGAAEPVPFDWNRL